MQTTGIRLEPFAAEQTAPAVEVWNRAAGAAFPLREEVLRQLVALNPSFRPDDAVAAWRGDRLVGFAVLIRYRGEAAPAAMLRDRGWLTAIAVDPAEQRRGIGREMVGWLLDRSGLPRDRVHPGAGTPFLVPGPPRELPAARPFLESLGWTFNEEVYDLRTDLSSPQARLIPDPDAQLADRGLVTRRCAPEDWPELMAFLAEEFPGGWWLGADLYRAAGGDPANWLILRDTGDGGRVIGMCRLHHPDSRPIGAAGYWASLRGPRAGGLGPIGVAAARRGEGIGKLLLASTLDHLRRLGVDDVNADWTALLGYYGPFGFRIWKTYDYAR